jgi:hypothetical protein
MICLTGIFIILFFNNIYSACLNDCSQNGYCDDNQCQCYLLYQGTNCSIKWTNDKTWMSVFYFYIALELFLMTIILIFSIYEIIIQYIYHKRHGKHMWNTVTYILICIIFASILRILDFGVDPDSFRGIYPRVVENLLFSIPLVFLIGAAYLQFLYWIELQKMSGIKQLKSVVKLRPLLIALTIILCLVLFPVTIWKGVLMNSVSNDVYAGAFAIFILSLIGLSCYSGWKLIKSTKSIWENTRVKEFKIFFKKLAIYIFFLNFIFVILIISLAIYSLDEVVNNRDIL